MHIKSMALFDYFSSKELFYLDVALSNFIDDIRSDILYHSSEFTPDNLLLLEQQLEAVTHLASIVHDSFTLGLDE